MTNLSLLLGCFFLISSPILIHCDGFFPDWKNCEGNIQIDFIDFYFDHHPNIHHSVNTLTFCVGEGKDVVIGGVNVQVTKNGTSGLLMNETYPSLGRMKFGNGMYGRCLSTGVNEFSNAGDYKLTLDIISQDDETQSIACLDAHWRIWSENNTLTE